jgi:hypothetical protein
MSGERLPDALIDAVISKLILTYGKRFTGHYDPFTPAQVREYWAHELGSMSEAGVRYALAHASHYAHLMDDNGDLSDAAPEDQSAAR